jgi:hypothetical protein
VIGANIALVLIAYNAFPQRNEYDVAKLRQLNKRMGTCLTWLWLSVAFLAIVCPTAIFGADVDVLLEIAAYVFQMPL